MNARGLVDIVASNIRAESARRGLYQRDIANALGLQQATVSKRWRGGRAWPHEYRHTLGCFSGVKHARGSVGFVHGDARK